MNPSISVIMPTYNRAHLIGRAIGSVLQQTFDDFELIVVDDGSTDNTEEVIRAFDDDRIVYIRCDENRGNAAARNVGLRKARGKYITFLDSDDEFMPGLLDEVYRLISKSDEQVGFVFTRNIRVRDTKHGEEIVKKSTWSLPAEVDTYLYFCYYGGLGYGATVKRECFQEIGFFDENLHAGVDRDMILRLAKRCECLLSHKRLMKIHYHPGERVTRNMEKKARSYQQIIEKHLPVLKEHPKILSDMYYKVALFYHRGGNSKGRREYLAKALQANPFDLKLWAMGLLFELFGSSAERCSGVLSSCKQCLVSLGRR